MEKINFSYYRYSPESAHVTVNGAPLDISNTNIGMLLCCGRHDEARQQIKKAYRKQIMKENNYVFAFFRENSKQFYYIACLRFAANADIKSRLYCYKELKHHMQNQPQTITTESGHVTPYGATAPEVKTEHVKIDFTKCKRLKIA